MTRPPRPIEDVIPFFDPLARRTAVIIEIDYPFHWIAEVCDDEAFGGKFAFVPLHLCDHSPRNISTLGLIGEIAIVNSRFSGEPFNGSQQHMCYFTLKRTIVWKSQGKPMPVGARCLKSSGLAKAISVRYNSLTSVSKYQSIIDWINSLHLSTL